MAFNILSCLREGPSNDDDVGVARGSVFHEIRTGSGVKTGDFVKEKSGGGGYRRTTLTRGAQYLTLNMTSKTCVRPTPANVSMRQSLIDSKTKTYSHEHLVQQLQTLPSDGPCPKGQVSRLSRLESPKEVSFKYPCTPAVARLG